MGKSGVFLNRNEIVQKINSIGNQKWLNFSCSEIYTVGKANRCDLYANDREAKLNLFFNSDGSTTIQVCGKNQDISEYVKVKLEECGYSGSMAAKSCSFKDLPDEWAEKLIKYLSSLGNISVEERTIETPPKHVEFTFVSTIGDKLTINQYETGTIVLQGKPAYIFAEAISFLSYCKDITVDDIIDSINVSNKVAVSSKDVRNELKALLPNASSGLDEVLVKIISPAIALRKVSIELEDYSCLAFPALRALEAYIKVLFKNKNITIEKNFGGWIDNNSLTAAARKIISDSLYENEIETLYTYLKNNRHVIFHTEQILVGTKLIEKRIEADAIVNEVLELIESSYTRLFI